jgi:hypothetical protein
MNTYTVKITGTNYSPYNTLSSFDILDGGFLFDPLAAPLSFYYSLTTNCGSLTGSNSVYTLTAVGGSFKTIYNDLKNYKFTVKGDMVFCKTFVNFDLSDFDQTRSIIKSIIFEPDNSEKNQIYSIKIGSSITYPNLNQSNSLYYPSEKFYTIYKPKFTINYNDGTSQTIVSPLTVAQCGILDSYKNKSMLDSVPYFKDLNSVAIFINDKNNNELLASLLDVKSPFVFDTSELDTVELPFSIAPIPLTTLTPFRLITQVNNNPTTIPIDQNPTQPPQSVYRYEQSIGIVLNPNPSNLILDESFSIFDNSIILSIGGAPYTGDLSIIVGDSIIPTPPTPTSTPPTPTPTPTQTPIIPTTPQQFSASYDEVTFQGYYQIQQNPTSSTDVILAFGGTIQNPNLVMDNALNQLNILRNNIGIIDKTIVTIAYPQNIIIGIVLIFVIIIIIVLLSK